jgi:hypothetical protein
MVFLIGLRQDIQRGVIAEQDNHFLITLQLALQPIRSKGHIGRTTPRQTIQSLTV